jgi:chloramphenicol-sensitive protein RarD
MRPPSDDGASPSGPGPPEQGIRGMDAPAPDRKPLAAALTCFLVWGLMPLLFQAIARHGGTPWETLCWRTVLSVPCVLLLVALTRQARGVQAVLAQPRLLGLLALSAALIGGNWAIYIWAVDHGHTLSASLGYYINPLFNMAAAAVIFRERVGALGRVAMTMAAAGVALQTWAVGEAPWAALGLAVSFGGYSIVRKVAAVEAQTGLLVECVILGAPAAVYLAMVAQAGGAAFGTNLPVTLWLLASGPWTVLPLVTFAYAARRLPLTAISFIQFLTPTMLFVIGAVQGEPLSALRLASFGFIWAGVAVYAAGAWRQAYPPPLRGREGPAV